MPVEIGGRNRENSRVVESLFEGSTLNPAGRAVYDFLHQANWNGVFESDEIQEAAPQVEVGDTPYKFLSGDALAETVDVGDLSSMFAYWARKIFEGQETRDRIFADQLEKAFPGIQEQTEGRGVRDALAGIMRRGTAFIDESGNSGFELDPDPRDAIRTALRESPDNKSRYARGNEFYNAVADEDPNMGAIEKLAEEYNDPKKAFQAGKNPPPGDGHAKNEPSGNRMGSRKFGNGSGNSVNYESRRSDGRPSLMESAGALGRRQRQQHGSLNEDGKG